MSCAGCLKSLKELDQEFAEAKKRAKEEARRLLKPVAIAFENDQYVLYDPFYAMQNHIPFKEVVSHL